MLASTLSPADWTSLSPTLRSLYEHLPQGTLGGGCRPLIGLTCHTIDSKDTVNEAYPQAILAAGGLPVLLPTLHTFDGLGELLDRLDGLLLTGGGDLFSPLMGKEISPQVGHIDPWRDRYEIALVLEASKRNIPLLGICRGLQIYNVAMGGTLIQDIAMECSGVCLEHSPRMDKELGCHTVTLESGGNILATLLGLSEGDSFFVNSLHHQAIGSLALGMSVLARSSDGIIEAATALPHKCFLGVQWHPEHLVRQEEGECMMELFRFLVQEATLYAKAREYHHQILVLDSHTDTPMTFTADTDLSVWGDTLVDLKKMELGGVASTVMAAYLPQGVCSDEERAFAQQYALDKLEEIHRQVAKNPKEAAIARSAIEIEQCFRQGLLCIVPAIENGYAIGLDKSLLKRYYDLGVVYITLCHNGDNDICDSARCSENRHQGLSPFGREVVQEMNRLGILIDVSHAAPSTVDEVLELSTQPVIASHSSCYALCPHPRNLSDEHIKAIASKGGVIQVCLYAGFIAEDENEATVQRAVDHIEHIIKIAGVESVGIGSDFDGDGKLIGCQGSHDLINITIELLRRGYDKADLRAILGGNFLRVLRQVRNKLA